MKFILAVRSFAINKISTGFDQRNIYGGFMNWMNTEENDLLIEKGCKESFRSGKFYIRCLRGILWITWPGSEDVILRAGDVISFETEGVLCMTALSNAFVKISKNTFIPGLKELPRFIIRKSIKSVFLFLKNDVHHSSAGESIHSITR